MSSGMLPGGSALYLSELRVAVVSKCILYPCKETRFVIYYPVWPSSAPGHGQTPRPILCSVDRVTLGLVTISP